MAARSVRLVVLFFALVATACGTAGTTTALTPTSVAARDSAYLDEIINAFQANSYFRAQIDWPALRKQVLAAIDGGMNRIDAILLAIKLVNDNHSYYILKGSTTIYFPFSTPECNLNASPRLPYSWPSDIGYIDVPAFSGTAAAASQYATTMQSSIRNQDRPSNSGWVIDLRGNGGGNYSPMIAGVGPVLGEGLAGYFHTAEGKFLPWGYSDGGLWQLSLVNRDVTVSNPYVLAVPARRVAVLTDSRTNSSGEATAVAFRGRTDTRSFGGQTCGRSSGIEGVTLSDGSLLGVLGVLDADRLRNVYGGVLVPDETIRDDTQLYARVVAWLREGR